MDKLEDFVFRTSGVNAEIELLAEVESSVHVALAAHGQQSGSVGRILSNTSPSTASVVKTLSLGDPRIQESSQTNLIWTIPFPV